MISHHTLPRSLADLSVPPEFAMLRTGENFLHFDSGPGDEERILIFCTSHNLSILSHAEHWSGDGTFKTVPELFFQLYTIAAFVCGRSITCVYALLPNKKAVTYVRMLRAIASSWQSFAPDKMLIDFEIAMIDALHTV